nr:MAG TPA: hypothetical protein [Caudoviricetes sp.]
MSRGIREKRCFNWGFGKSKMPRNTKKYLEHARQRLYAVPSRRVKS